MTLKTNFNRPNTVFIDKDEKTALHIAVQRRDLKIVKVLLEHKA